MHYYQRNLGDYARDTKHLTFVEHGAYNVMMDWCYASERPLPKDKEEVYLLMCARSEEERWAIDRILKVFFIDRSYGWTHKRIISEIRQYSALRHINAVNGRKGGNKHQATANRPLTDRQANQEPRTMNQNHEPNREARRKEAALLLPQGFNLNEEMKKFATSKGMSLIEEEFAQFLDRHRSKGSRFVDWEAAWRTWVRNWIKFGGQNGKSQGSNRNTGKLAAEAGKQYRQPTVLRA